MSDIMQKISNKTAKICVMGLGYVGLPTAVYLAKAGFKVIGLDPDKGKLESINQGISPIKDLNLDGLLEGAVASGRLSATREAKRAISNSDIILIVVPTPITESKEPDLSFIKNASEDISKHLRKGQMVVLESTVYPGVTEEIIKPILEKSGLKAGEDFGLIHCPERYNPGDPDHALDKVSRIVGGITPEWAEVARELYKNVVKSVTVVNDIKTAEAAKIIENIQRDLNIALMNELALIFERMGIDVMDVINAASTKWNFVKYYPGAGVGGHCLPHDPYYLTKKAQELGYIPRVILAGRGVNDSMPHHIFELLVDGMNKVKKAINGSRILILGASYKGNTDDLRTSPTEALVKELKEKGAEIVIVEPFVEGDVFGCKTYQKIESGKGVDAIVLMTAHDDFVNLNLKELREKFDEQKVVFVDGRRVFDPEKGKKYFVYRGIGAIND